MKDKSEETKILFASAVKQSNELAHTPLNIPTDKNGVMSVSSFSRKSSH